MIKVILSVVVLLAGVSAYVYVSIPAVGNLKADCIHVNMHKIKVCRSSDSYVDINHVSQELLDVILVSEDVDFYGHRGFEWYEIKQSFIKNLLKGRFARGGSTITQQLVKNLYLSSEKSVFRKIREAYLTNKIEHILTKDQILELYINVVELGADIYGVQAASDHYFNTNPGSVTALQGAYLAYLLPSPIKYSKSFEEGELTDYADKRVRDLLSKMLSFKKLEPYLYDQYVNAIPLFPWKI